MDLNEFRNQLLAALNNGSLVTPKHDPNVLGTTVFESYRTVLSSDLANNLESFISSGKYTVTEYENKKIPSSPFYFEIKPDQDSEFTVPASGITANSTFASTVLDRIVAVSGQTKGWHLFGESSTAIQLKTSNGDLDKKDILQ